MIKVVYEEKDVEKNSDTNFNAMKNESCATWCCLGTFPLTYQGALVLFLRVAHDMFTVHEGDEM